MPPTLHDFINNHISSMDCCRLFILTIIYRKNLNKIKNKTLKKVVLVSYQHFTSFFTFIYFRILYLPIHFQKVVVYRRIRFLMYNIYLWSKTRTCSKVYLVVKKCLNEYKSDLDLVERIQEKKLLLQTITNEFLTLNKN